MVIILSRQSDRDTAFSRSAVLRDVGLNTACDAFAS
jgi:hypothetical protein